MRTDFAPFFLIGLLVLALLAVLCLIRAIMGPKLADRILAVNMTGTISMAMIAILAVLLDEPSVLDVALIYAVISFVAVIVLMKIYVGIYREKTHAMTQREKAASHGPEQEGDQ